MAKPATAKPRRRLKVFQARLGFYDTVVAAASRPAALRAWGVHQDLFAGGDARESDDAAAIEAALQHPEVPLRRAVGSTAAFALEPEDLPVVPEGPKRKPPAKAKAKRAPKPEPDRRALDAAEAALSTLEEARKRETAELQRRQDALDAERDAAQAAYVAARKGAVEAVSKARKAYKA